MSILGSGSACSAACGFCGGCSAAWEREDDDFEPDPPESPVERAANSILASVADFHLAIDQAHTVDTALQVHALIEQVLSSVWAASRAAADKADFLCGRY